VTRRGTKLRQITNEAELVADLERRGFRTLQATWRNHPEQVEAFSRAAVVIGVHGAGLTNIVFAQPGTHVVEIFPADHRKTTYLHLSAEHDLVYQPFFGSPQGANQAFSVDTKAFFAALDPLL
jgi:capsular polysaccharide biosynthesis protein